MFLTETWFVADEVLLGARVNTLTQSESMLLSSWGGWEHLEVLRSTGKGYCSV